MGVSGVRIASCSWLRFTLAWDSRFHRFLRCYLCFPNVTGFDDTANDIDDIPNDVYNDYNNALNTPHGVPLRFSSPHSYRFQATNFKYYSQFR